MNKTLIDHCVKESEKWYFFNHKMKDTAIASDLQEISKYIKIYSKKKNLVVFILEDKYT